LCLKLLKLPYNILVIKKTICSSKSLFKLTRNEP
jgi:hypothetical protein